MRIDENLADGLGTALNEATLLGVEYDPRRNMAGVTVSVLTLPDDHSPEPADPRRQLILTNTGRIAAALRESRWDDLSAETVPIDALNLLSTVQSFGGQPIHGWQFINHEDPPWENWKERLSLDIRPNIGSLENRLMLFQEAPRADRHLDIWIWFEELIIRDAAGNAIDADDFVAGGIRWWEAMHAGDSRTQGHGLVSGGKDS
jgi:hypothetical protein